MKPHLSVSDFEEEKDGEPWESNSHAASSDENRMIKTMSSRFFFKFNNSDGSFNLHFFVFLVCFASSLPFFATCLDVCLTFLAAFSRCLRAFLS